MSETDPIESGRCIEAALVQAQLALQAVHKDRRNDFHRYDYASAEAMLTACRNALNSSGLAATASEWKLKKWGEASMVVTVKCRLVHESGASRTDKVIWPVIPEKGRPVDKALAASLTSSLSYWLRSLLLVPRDDETMDSRDDRKYEPQAQAAQAKPKPRRKVAPKKPPAPKPIAKKASVYAGPEVVMDLAGATRVGQGEAEVVCLTGEIAGDSVKAYIRDQSMFDGALELEEGIIVCEIESQSGRNGQEVLVVTQYRRPKS